MRCVSDILWRIIVGGVFLVAAVSKYREGVNYGPPQSIYDRMVQSRPERHYVMLAVEAGVGLWLLSGWRKRWASGMAGILLLGFIALMLWELRRTDPDVCGCGISAVYPEGNDPRLALKIALVRDAVLLAGCIWMWLLSEGIKATKPA